MKLLECKNSNQIPFISFGFFEESCDVVQMKTNFRASDGYAMTSNGSNIILRLSEPEGVPYSLEIIGASHFSGELNVPTELVSNSVITIPSICSEDLILGEVEITFDKDRGHARVLLRQPSPELSYQRYGRSLGFGLNDKQEIVEIWILQILPESSFRPVESEHLL